jgi:hypothetical protein
VRIGVVGGGIQGAGVAIELAQRGCTVEILEQDAICLARASAQNEGKIHLGFVYANDKTLETAQLCARTAVRFWPIVNRWLEGSLAPKISRPFHYLVHRDSVLARPDLQSFYGHVSRLLAAESAHGDYFGIDVSIAPVPVCGSALDSIANRQSVEAAFLTSEVAVDPEQVAAALRRRLSDDPRITVRAERRVTSISPSENWVQITSSGRDGSALDRYDHVVNASWENLISLDSSAGVSPPYDYTYRYKCFLRLSSELILPSATIVLGAFGDIVAYDDCSIFLSWYPIGRREMSVNSPLVNGTSPLSEGEADEVRRGIVEGLANVIPDLDDLSHDALLRAELGGGVIYARGASDIDDPASGLHRRQAVGPRSFGRYHSIDPGKYSFAPFFAELLAKRIVDRDCSRDG